MEYTFERSSYEYNREVVPCFIVTPERYFGYKYRFSKYYYIGRRDSILMVEIDVDGTINTTEEIEANFDLLTPESAYMLVRLHWCHARRDDCYLGEEIELHNYEDLP